MIVERFQELNKASSLQWLHYRIFFLSGILIINIILLFIAYELDNNNWTTEMSILSIFQLVINIFALCKLGEKIFSLPVLFLLFSFIFHFGNIIIFGFYLDSQFTIDIVNTVSNNTIMEAAEFTLFVQSFVAVGMFIVLISNKHHKDDSDLTKEDDGKYLHLIRTLGIILVLIGIVPALYIDIGKLILFFSSGYLSTYSLSQNGLFIILARLLKVGVFLLIIGNKKKLKLATVIFIIAVFYQLLVMLSGNRGRSVVELIGLFYIYTNIVYKIKVKDILTFSIISYFGIVLINALSIFRLSDSPDLEDLMVALSESFQRSPLLLVLHEFGGTILTVCYSFMFFSGSEFIQYGTNYLYSFLTVFPNVMGIFDSIHNNAVYVMNFPGSYQQSLGGSYIGELYYSFKQFGIPFALILGVFISLFSKKIKQAIVYKRYVTLCIFMIIFPDVLWWVRGYFIEIVRYPIWISLVVYIIYSFLKGNSKKYKME